MTPLIKHRQPITLAPVDATKVQIGDIVYAKVHGRMYLHKVNAVQGDQVQIANNHGRVNGWTSRDNIFGIVIAVGGTTRTNALDKVRR